MIRRDKESWETIAKTRLQDIIEDTNIRKKKLDTNLSNYRSLSSYKDHVPLKIGKLADYIAGDLLDFQDPINEMDGKANSTEFSVLQASLALYKSNRDSLQEVFKTCNLIESKNPHPFLHKINYEKCNGLLDFYEQYLIHKKKYLVKCEQDQDFENYRFLKIADKYKERHTKAYIKSLAAKLEKCEEMNLPRGLFKEPILQALSKDESSALLSSQLQNSDKVNITYIIKKYFEEVLGDSYQPFYDFKRHYEILDKLFDDRKGADKRKSLRAKGMTTVQLHEFIGLKKEDKLTIYEAYINKRLVKKGLKGHKKEEEFELELGKIQHQYVTFKDNEKSLRFEKMCDQVLFLTVNELLNKYFKENKDAPHVLSLGGDNRLNLISPKSEKGLLAEKLNARISISYKYLEASDVAESTGQKHVNRPDLKIKNYGDFRAFLRDRRLEKLLPFISPTDITYEAIRQELYFFEKTRLQVFEKLHEFENAILNRFPEMKSGANFVKHSDLLNKVTDGSDHNFTKAKALRNAFSHSEYPVYWLFKDVVNGDRFNELSDISAEMETVNISIAQQLGSLLSDYYDGFLASS